MLAKEKPIFTKEIEKFSNQNKLDEEILLIGLHISSSLLFHVDDCKKPKKIWVKSDSPFGRDNEFWAMQLEMDLSSLIPDEHASIEDYLTKFKSLIARLKGCGKTKSDSECIFFILSKLKDPYHVFCFSFYSTMDALGDDFKIPTFDLFCECLTRKQSKLQ